MYKKFTMKKKLVALVLKNYSAPLFISKPKLQYYCVVSYDTTIYMFIALQHFNVQCRIVVRLYRKKIQWQDT
ncbi:hypothetical protein MA16_Dca010359 [Dendrobium catenatum]|uniref:Uncharacterized protein n=1 Tax=Dendrobium catenatum TaxID=906689 RepID=A0A2I0X830_9ASPA|nr:hypothetical protein MA16_Dca010359 [Dendrobium catenatum]